MRLAVGLGLQISDVGAVFCVFGRRVHDPDTMSHIEQDLLWVTENIV